MDDSYKRCAACRGELTPLTGADIARRVRELAPGWRVDARHIEKQFTFPDFLQALAFTNRVGELAEEDGHHPDIHLAWGSVRLVIWTHAVKGLTDSDFVLASKADRAFAAARTAARD